MAMAYKKTQKRVPKVTGGGVVRPVGTAKMTKTPQIVPKSGSGTIKSKRLTTTPVYETPGFKPGTRNLKKK